MADVPEEASKIVVSEPVYRDGRIHFDSCRHPKLEAALAKEQEILAAIETKLASQPELSNKWNEAKNNVALETLSREQRAKLTNDFHSAHVNEKFTEVKNHFNDLKMAQNDALKAAGELHAEQVKKLGTLEVLEGATKEQFAEAVRDFEKEGKRKLKESDRILNPTFLKNHFAVFREDGMWAAMKHNFGGEAWKQRTGKTLFKGAGVLVGLGAIIDATFRAETTSPDGKPVERGFVARLAEAGAGALVAAVSAVHGGRTT